MTESNVKKPGTISAEKIDRALAESFGEEADWNAISDLGLSPRDCIANESEEDRQQKLQKAINLLSSSDFNK